MARTAVPLTNLVKNGGIDAPSATTAVDPTNGHSIDVATQAGRVIIWVSNTFAATKVITVKAGTATPAFRRAIGDLAYTASASLASYVGPFESARFLQADGKIYVDLASGITGFIAALWLPDGV